MTDAVVRDIIVKARETLSDAAHWTKGAYARDKNGVKCDARNRLSYSYCTIGALTRVSEIDSGQWVEAADALCKELPPEFDRITAFNDAATTNHADVLALFDRAIAHANTETVS